jgi:hypothetical protein
MLASFDAIQGASMGVYGRLSGFLPSALFASGEEGAWYDPSDLSTLFQDSEGTTPVTTAGQPVGLMLDKSKGLVLGPELTTNGNFATASDWTLAADTQISGGNLSTTTTVAGEMAAQVVSIEAGKTYKIQYTVLSTNGNIIVPRLSGNSNSSGPASTTTGTFTGYILAVSGTDKFAFNVAGTGLTATISDVSVKELPGNHATQATSAARPTYQYEWDGVGPLGPELVTNGTFDTDLTGWTNSGSWSWSGGAAVTTGTFGTLTQFVGEREKSRQISIHYVKTSSRVQLQLIDSTAVNPTTSLGGVNDLSTLGSSPLSVTLPAGYDTIRFTTTDADAQWSIDNISVKEVPVGSRLQWLAFDGVDDGMATGTITPNVDKAQVFAGARKLSDASSGQIVGSSTAPSTANGSFGVFAPNTFSNVPYWSELRGTTRIYTDTGSFSSFPAPHTDVLTFIYDIGGTAAAQELKARVGGANQTLVYDGTSVGTGNFLAYSLFIGSRATSFYFNGNIYGLITRFGANLTDAQIASTEAYVAAKTGVTL